MTTLSSYPGWVTLELSEQHPDLLVAALRHAIVTIHNVTGAIEIIAGEPEEAGYVESVGSGFAGLCGSRESADGSLLLARFDNPRGLMRDLSNPDVIYLAVS